MMLFGVDHDLSSCAGASPQPRAALPEQVDGGVAGADLVSNQKQGLNPANIPYT